MATPDVTRAAGSEPPQQQQSSGRTEEATGKASEVAGQAQEQAKQVTGQAKDRLREQVDERSTEAGRQVSGTAGDLRSVGEQLREQGKDTPAKLADQAADRIESVGSYLTDSDSDRILSDVEDYARRQPLMVALGGLALGFAASRFLKASSSQRYQSRFSSNGSGGPSPRPVSKGPARDGTSPMPAAGTPVTGDPGGTAGQGLPGSRA